MSAVTRTVRLGEGSEWEYTPISMLMHLMQEDLNAEDQSLVNFERIANIAVEMAVRADFLIHGSYRPPPDSKEFEAELEKARFDDAELQSQTSPYRKVESRYRSVEEASSPSTSTRSKRQR